MRYKIEVDGQFMGTYGSIKEALRAGKEISIDMAMDHICENGDPVPMDLPCVTVFDTSIIDEQGIAQAIRIYEPYEQWLCL